ncbi:MAG: DsrE family protein [Gammaproteobacteria bacterium]
MYKIKSIFIIIVLSGLLFSSFAYAEKPTDSDALQDVNEGKIVWDVTVGNPIKLLLLMKVIEETYDDILRQDVKPDMIFTFHGPVVKLISSQPLDLALDEEDAHEELLDRLRKFSKKPGVRMESCSVAARLLGIDNDTILPEVKPVGNTFVSLMGYQNKGYALIPIY